MKQCLHCHTALEDGDRFCKQCGAPAVPSHVAPPPVAPPGHYGYYGVPPLHKPLFRPNRAVAVLLAFLLGGIGMHKFYLRRVVQGALYLVFCWTLIPAIVALIEGILYLCWSEQQFDYSFRAEGGFYQ